MPPALSAMWTLHFIPDDQNQSKIQVLAEAQRLPVWRRGSLAVFEDVNDPMSVLHVLKAAGLSVPALR